MVSLMEPHLNRFCLAIKDLYNDGVIVSDGFEYLTLCDFHICSSVSLGLEGSFVLRLLPTHASCCRRSHFSNFWCLKHNSINISLVRVHIMYGHHHRLHVFHFLLLYLAIKFKYLRYLQLSLFLPYSFDAKVLLFLVWLQEALLDTFLYSNLALYVIYDI